MASDKHPLSLDEEVRLEEKNLQLERLVFFSDAVVAIAITLLALDIKIEPIASGHLRFSDIFDEWKVFAAFVLSFINIANFWKTHHAFFAHIRRIDERLLWFNIFWLFFIVTLPFSTSLVSSYFFDTPAIFLYSLNTFCVAVFQNFIWDYASGVSGGKEGADNLLKKDNITDFMIGQYRLFCNLDMLNALLAIVLSFISPPIAFVSLFTKLPLIVLARMYYGGRERAKRGPRSGREERQQNHRPEKRQRED